MKKLNEKQKKIVNITITALQVAIVLIAVILSSIILANPNAGNGKVGSGATKLLPVLTDSMAGDREDSFKTGDLIIAKKVKDPNALEVNDIITFVIDINGTEQLNTHRIVGIYNDSTGKKYYRTQGDNPETNANQYETVYPEEVLAQYKSHLKGVGAAIYWLQQPTNFLLVVVLPLILLFVYNIILFVRMLMQAKFEKEKEKQAQSGAAVDEEAIRQKAIEEYLAKQAAEAEVAKADDKPDGTDE